MATESQDWNANMKFCASNSNPSPQILDWDLTNDLIAFGSNCNIHILSQSNGNFSTHQVLTGHTSNISCLRWLSYPNTKTTTTTPLVLLVTGTTGGGIRVWENSPLKCTQTFILGENSINSISARMTGLVSHLITAACSEVAIFRRDLKVSNATFEEIHRIDFGYNYVLGVDITYIGTGTELVPILACGSDNGKVHLYNISDLTKICDLLGHEDWIRNVEFCETSDGQYLATASQDCYVRIWRLNLVIECEESAELKMKEIVFHTSSSSGVLKSYKIQLETVLQCHEDWCYSVSWAPVSSSISSSLKLLTASMDRTVAVWSPSGTDGVWEESMRAGEVGGNTLGLYGARFGPGGVKIVSHGYQGALHLWEYVSDKWEGRPIVGGHFGTVSDLSWSPSGKYFISVSSDQTARLWAEWCEEWHELARTQIHGYDLVRCCAISDTMYVSAADEKVVRVFSSPLTFIDNFKHLTNQSISRPLNVPLGANVPALGLSNKAVFNVTQQTKENTFDDFKNAPQFTPFNLSSPPLEETLLQHTLWPEERKLYGHTFEVYALATSRDGTIVASACKASKPDQAGVILWSVEKWSQIQTLSFHTLTISKLAFSNNSQLLLAVSRDRTWSLWKRNGMQFELISHSKLSVMKHTRIIWDCSWTMDDVYFATGSRDMKIIVWGEVVDSKWDCVSQKPLTLEEAVTALQFCHFSKRHILAVGLENGKILIVTFCEETKDLNIVKFLDEYHAAMVTCIAWRPESTIGMHRNYQLATSSADYSVRIYNISPPNIV
ncbi:Elongator complex protein 2 isoform X2 [Oopsacas minuta]|uniref:Elongator complex protein 2 n=1 Tax=Oopsacas minuta TaxID=111878 RepID=A0AAV7JMT0_9METZ|nr:Elongator complex protein 2 isoform X2 [Oopsacas minuta]